MLSEWAQLTWNCQPQRQPKVEERIAVTAPTAPTSAQPWYHTDPFVPTWNHCGLSERPIVISRKHNLGGSVELGGPHCCCWSLLFLFFHLFQNFLILGQYFSSTKLLAWYSDPHLQSWELRALSAETVETQSYLSESSAHYTAITWAFWVTEVIDIVTPFFAAIPLVWKSQSDYLWQTLSDSLGPLQYFQVTLYLYSLRFRTSYPAGPKAAEVET